MAADDDDFEDEGPLPDPTDRPWRHPSELAALAAMEARESRPPSGGRPVATGSLLLGAALGAAVVLGAVVTAGLFRDDPAATRFPLRDPAAVTTTAAPAPPASSTTVAGATTTAAPVTSPTTTPVALTPLGPELGALGQPTVPATAVVAVLINAEDRSPRCSGLVVGGAVVTSATAIGGATNVTLVVGGVAVPGTVVGRDRFSDVAVITLDRPTELTELAPAPTPGVDTPVALVATDGRPEPIVVLGRVTAVDESGWTSGGSRLVGLVATSARLPEPAAGSLLVDATGALVGMVVDTPDHLASAVPAATLHHVARSLLDTGHPASVWVGVSLLDVDGGAGVAVEAVDRGGPAASAGLRAGDVVVAVGSEPVTDTAHFIATVRAHAVGDRMALSVLRAGRTEQVELVLAAPGGDPPSDGADGGVGGDAPSPG